MKLLVLFMGLMFIAPPTSVYDFKLKNIDGQAFSLAQYKGKKVLIVNTASKCGFTPQYAELQKLADLYKDKLVIVGFPANNFGQQEPGANSEIKTFCEKRFGVTFPLSEKVSVKGDDIYPLFKYLTEAPNPDFTGEIKWNFEKFLSTKMATWYIVSGRQLPQCLPRSQSIYNQREKTLVKPSQSNFGAVFSFVPFSSL